MIYIYQANGEGACISRGAPTPNDLELVNCNVLVIYKVEGDKVWEYDHGGWRIVDEAHIVDGCHVIADPEV